MSDLDEDDLPDLNKEQLAEFLGKPISHVELLVTQERIPFYWAGNGRDPRFLRAEARAYRNKLRRENRVEAREPTTSRRETSPQAYDKAVQRQASRNKKTAAVP